MTLKIECKNNVAIRNELNDRLLDNPTPFYDTEYDLKTNTNGEG